MYTKDNIEACILFTQVPNDPLAPLSPTPLADTSKSQEPTGTMRAWNTEVCNNKCTLWWCAMASQECHLKTYRLIHEGEHMPVSENCNVSGSSWTRVGRHIHRMRMDPHHESATRNTQRGNRKTAHNCAGGILLEGSAWPLRRQKNVRRMRWCTTQHSVLFVTL